MPRKFHFFKSDSLIRRHDLPTALSAIVCFCLGLAFLLSGTLSARAEGGVDSAISDSEAVETDSALSVEVAPRLVYLLEISEPIGVVTAKRIVEAIALAEEDSAEALVIMLDTPGGFTNATWTIDKAILNSHVPVIVYIAPSGARAGSAGVYITYAAHIAAMAEGTNIGAAHPVSGEGKDIDSTMNEKVTNDAVASIRSMAEKHGRNADWAEDAVRNSVSITDRVADSLNVIDLRAGSLAELYEKINGRTVETPAGSKTLVLDDVNEVQLFASFIEKVLRVITSPDIAFLLFSIGGLGIMLELYNPGAILPGVVGGISLILAFYAFSVLPINTTGLLFIIFALVLFLAEIKVTSFGLLTIGGVISLVLGGLMLIDAYDPAMQVSRVVVYSVALGIGSLMALVAYFVARSYGRQVSTGSEGMVGQLGEARSDLDPDGSVYVAGELWQAKSHAPIKNGALVMVQKVEGIHLIVRERLGDE